MTRRDAYAVSAVLLPRSARPVFRGRDAGFLRSEGGDYFKYRSDDGVGWVGRRYNVLSGRSHCQSTPSIHILSDMLFKLVEYELNF